MVGRVRHDQRKAEAPQPHATILAAHCQHRKWAPLPPVDRRPCHAPGLYHSHPNFEVQRLQRGGIPPLLHRNAPLLDDSHQTPFLSSFTYRPLDPSGILCRPPLDPSAGVCFVKRKVESSIPVGSNFSPYLLDGACY
jgi:hypothetical protein